MTKIDEKIKEIIRKAAGQFIAINSNRLSLITVTSINMAERGKRVIVLVTVFPEDKAEEAVQFLKRMRSDFKAYVHEHTSLQSNMMFDFDIDRGEKNRQRVDEKLSKG